MRRTRPLVLAGALGLSLSLGACKEEGVDEMGEVIVRQTIGPEGGDISGGGITLHIPALALTAETEVEIRTSKANLSAADFTQSGEAVALYPDGLVLRQPAELSFTKAPDGPAVLFEQDGLTVAAMGTTAWINEFGAVSIAAAGTQTVSMLMPMLGATPDSAGAPIRDLAHLQVGVADVADLHMSLTIYDPEGQYAKPLNGTGDGDCGFEVENLSGGSLASGCTEGFHTATVRVSSDTLDFDIVPFLAGKMEVPVVVGVVMGGDELAFQLGFFSFDTGPCFNETCSGVGTCVVGGDGTGSCECVEGYAPEGLECICVPQCDGRVCGGDSCGGQCGPGCSDDQFCDNDSGQCVDDMDPDDGSDTMPPADSGDGTTTGDPPGTTTGTPGSSSDGGSSSGSSGA